jgi:hypothetical protein
LDNTLRNQRRRLDKGNSSCAFVVERGYEQLWRSALHASKKTTPLHPGTSDANSTPHRLSHKVMFLPHLFSLSSARNINTSVLEERLLEGGLHDSRHHWVSIASSARELLCGYQFTSGWVSQLEKRLID